MHLPLLDQALGIQDPGIPCWNDSTLSQPLPQAPPPRSRPCLQCTQAVGKVQLFAGAGEWLELDMQLECSQACTSVDQNMLFGPGLQIKVKE